MGKPLIRLKAVTMRTRPPGSFEVFAPSIDIAKTSVPRGSASRIASADAFAMAGIGPEDIALAQLQDTEAGAEIMHMAENGFCRDGEQEESTSPPSAPAADEPRDARVLDHGVQHPAVR